jgi:hypothetical protein
VKVWDAATGKNLLTLKGHTESVSSVAISPDGRRIVSGSNDRTLKIWDADTGQDLLSLKGHTWVVSSVAFSPDGQRIATASLDNTISVWDAGGGADLLWLKGHSRPVSRVGYSPDGKRVFGQDDCGKVLTWDVTTGHLLPDAPADIPANRRMAVHGRHRACVDGYLVRIERIVDANERHRVRLEEERIQGILQAQVNHAFHAAEAEAATDQQQPCAAVFHLDRLLPLVPGEHANLLNRRTAVLTRRAEEDAWRSVGHTRPGPPGHR